jgi:serine/threonine-protein kinase
MSEQRTDLVGEHLMGGYLIERKLGEGAMGAVYLARQQDIDQKVAIKVLHSEAAKDHETQQRFLREAKVISMMTHPNCIRVFVFGETARAEKFMAMEYVEGENLRARLIEGLLDELEVIKVMKQICSALAEAHDLGIAHRDLKPENILLTRFRGERNFVKILDFGIAKILDPDGSQQLTQAGIVYGTPEYISPEQAQALELDHRTDIYSLGCILYELVSGKVPFHAKSALKTLEQQAFQAHPSLKETAPDRASTTMTAIVDKAMQKDPQKRFQTALEMFDALEERELELLRQRNLPATSAHTPGAELSGIFRAIKDRDVAAIRKNPDLRTIVVINALGIVAIVGLLFAILLVLVLA